MARHGEVPRARRHTGDPRHAVTAGNLGDETRYECAVTGDTVEEAALLSDLAKSSPSGFAERAEVVEVGHGDRSWQPAGRPRLRGTTADTPFHLPSETG